MPTIKDIRELPGIGEKRAALFKKLGIETVEDLITYYPRDYVDKTIITPIPLVMVDEINTIRAKVISSGINRFYNGKTVTEFTVSDANGSIAAIWFNRPYLIHSLNKHSEYVFTGKVIHANGKLRIYPSDYQKAEEAFATGIVPVYRLTEGLTQKLFRKTIAAALNCVTVTDVTPDVIIEKYNLAHSDYAVRNIHFPETREAFYKARERLVFDELFALRAALFTIRDVIKNKHSGVVFSDVNTESFLKMLPYTLTPDQRNAVTDIVSDVASGRAMIRLLLGDVGSGKTAVAAAACYLCVKNGYQAAIMTPTEVLAKQHYEYFSSLFDNVTLLTSNMSAADRKKGLSDIKNGAASIVIGTHAIIQQTVEFMKLALCVTDEQHRFGVMQRRVFAEKGTCPHTLVMTATPIPRSLAMVLYGDMDTSVISQLPPNRKKVDTYAVSTAYRKRIFEFVKKETDKGNQAFFICPRVTETSNSELMSVSSYENELLKHINDVQISKLYGKMKTDEKNAVMEAFRSGFVKILISTTVIEVGIDVPAATVIVIENAEMFGLSQLHQMRGRVGRGREQSYCILISDSKSPITKKRLEAMSQTLDGFELSKLDLAIRGPGDFFGTKQHGLPEMKISNLYTDSDILQKTGEALNSMTPENITKLAKTLNYCDNLLKNGIIQ